MSAALMEYRNAEPALVWGVKDPDMTDRFFFDFEQYCAFQWLERTDFGAGQRIRLYDGSDASGFEFEWSGGRTSGRMPRMPSILGVSVKDGSGAWTCRSLSDTSLSRTITGLPTWTPDAGITASNVLMSGLVCSALLAGGVDGNTYGVLLSAPTTDGVIVVRCLLPVARSRVLC